MTDSRQVELKPCPFCGSEAELKWSHVEGLGRCWYGHCPNKGCLCSTVWSEFRICEKQLAIDMWNTRPSPASKVVWPSKKDEYYTDEYAQGFNSCRDQFMAKIKEMGL